MAIKEYLLHSFRLKILALVIFPSVLFIFSALIVISVLRTRLSDDVQAVLSEHMNNLYTGQARRENRFLALTLPCM